MYFFIDESNTDNTPEILKKASVKKENLYSYTLKKNNSVKDSVLSVVALYNESGQFLKIENYDDRGKLSSVETFEYLDSFHLSSSRLFNISWNTIYTSSYLYDGLGREIIKYTKGSNNSEIITEQKQYDERGLLISLITKDNKNYSSVKKYEYYPDRKLSKVSTFDERGKIEFVDSYKYESGKKISFLSNPEGITKQAEFYYDTLDRCVMYISPWQIKYLLPPDSADYNDSTKVSHFIYNDDGTLYEWSVRIRGKIVQLQKHYYSK
jgi:hypothetical protein